MRVLDLGCGAGDVSFLAADLVGASGSVVGIDQNPDVVAFARERARSYELPQVTFRDVALEAFSDAEPFDAVIGRYVLVHQSDPNAFLRAAADCVRRGGVLAFHELDLVRGVVSLPSVPLWNAVTEMILTAFRATLVHGDVGGRLIEHFFDAGLPSPNLFGELLIGGGEQSPLYSWIVESLRSVQPQLVKMGIVTADGLPLATLEASLRKSVVEARSQIIGPAQICAWTQLPA
jgi:SAM-dependent methyltransferase